MLKCCGKSDNLRKMAKPLKYNKTLYIRVTNELFELIKKRAKKLKIPPTIFVRTLLERELEEMKNKMSQASSERKIDSNDLNHRIKKLTLVFVPKLLQVIYLYGSVVM